MEEAIFCGIIYSDSCHYLSYTKTSQTKYLNQLAANKYLILVLLKACLRFT